jgi:hypothetical protein
MTEEITGEPPENKTQADDAPTYKYDIAVSFAGEQRDFVHDVVRGLNLPKDRVFYDADYTAELLGEDLAEVFTKLYRDEARYVVMFISDGSTRRRSREGTVPRRTSCCTPAAHADPGRVLANVRRGCQPPVPHSWSSASATRLLPASRPKGPAPVMSAAHTTG